MVQFLMNKERQIALTGKQNTHLFIQKLFREHNTGLLKFLSRKTGDPEEAQDIAQTAYEKLIGVEAVEGLENAKSYLYQTALNLAIDRMRRQQRANNYQQIIQEQEEDGDAPGFSPEQLVASKQQLERVNQALAELPKACQSAFLMHRAQQLSYREISDTLGVSVSMVEKHII